MLHVHKRPDQETLIFTPFALTIVTQFIIFFEMSLWESIS